jgi:hypothetical protein
MDWQVWSVYRAERSQPVAAGGKWNGREDGPTRRKLLGAVGRMATLPKDG